MINQYRIPEILVEKMAFFYLSNVVKQFVLFIYRQFYSTRESARYKMPGWFVSVGQVGVNEQLIELKR